MYKRAAPVATVLVLVLWFTFYSQLSEPTLENSETEATAPAEVATEPDPVGDLEAMECRLDVERWDTGRRAEVEAKYGEDAEGCRAEVIPLAP